MRNLSCSVRGAWLFLALFFPLFQLSAQDEFVGPFASWTNAKSVYGARGDGTTDDTAALQRALNDLGASGRPDVLYLPAGTYRITGTLRLTYKIGVSVLGEHPDKTIIRWDGPSGGSMFIINGVTISRFGRITWDGASRAGAGVAHQWDRAGGYAPTNIEHADEVFKDMGKGMIGGLWGGANDAEVAIVRSKFLRCSVAGLSIESFNALDYWVWDSEFTDNARGVTNEFGAGNFNVYRSIFRNSKIADITMLNTQFFSFRGNTSVGSQQFILAKNMGQNGSRVTVQDNKILDTANPVAIDLGNLGPLVLIDNQIRSSPGAAGPAVRISTWATGGDTVSLGNKFTVANAVATQTAAARMWTQDDQVVSYTQIDSTVPALPGTAPNLNRRVFEVAAGASAATIQNAINQAAALAGQRPVVHLPKGSYSIGQMLVIPANADVQVVGDGYGTTLNWAGGSGGAIFQLSGPSKATLRDMSLRAGQTGNGIVIENADQPGARVHTDGMYQEYASQYNFLADGLTYTNINLQNHQTNHQGGVSIKVIGNAGQGNARLALFGGCSGAAGAGDYSLFDVANGGRLMIQDLWYEGPAARIARLMDSGTFTYHSGHVAISSAAPLVPAIELNNFRGRATVLGLALDLNSLSRRVQVTSENSTTGALFLGMEGNLSGYFARLSSGGQVSFLNSKLLGSSGQVPTPDMGDSRTANFITAQLEQTRTVKPSLPNGLPAGITDVRIYRVAIANPVIGVRIRPGSQVPVGTNQPPTVSAGPGSTITLPSAATLSGRASDDGLPSNILTTTWSKFSGPGTVTFANPGSPATTAAFSAAGTYVLRLTASDTALTASSDVTVVANASGSTTPPPSGFTPIRVDAGGTGYTDNLGQRWSADAGYSGGSTYTTAYPISGTSDPGLYQTERWNPGGFRYLFAVPNGTYNVKLKFAEIYLTQPGRRLFSVAINNQTVLSNFDILAQAGGANVALDRSFAVSTTSGQIAIQFSAIVDNPKINAIEILAAATPVTVAVNPRAVSLAGSQTQQFVATVSGSTNSAVTWSLSPQVGTLSSAGLYTAPATITSTQTVTVAATSAADTTKSATATVTLTPPASGGAFTPIRVNAGGGAYTDPLGQVWSTDTNFSGGSVYTTASPIANTTATALYQSERWKPGSLQYAFAVPNGSYMVNLKFAEIYLSQPNQRVFTVAINGLTVLSNFDIVAEAGGPNTAIDKPFPVSVTTGQIAIQFSAVVDNPKVNAIEIVAAPVGVSVTPGTASLTASQTQQFTATVTGTTYTAVTWSLSPQVGSISSAGLYSAPATVSSAQTVTVTAKSVADPTKAASAKVTLSPPAAPAFTPILVNAGGPSYTDPLGQVWKADTNFTAGTTYAVTAAISGTTTPYLYQTERYSQSPFQYQFAVPNGTYTVKLKFAEIFFNKAGQRAFNVAINGQTVLSNFDIAAQAGGPNVALDRSFTVNVTGGQIAIQFSPIRNNPKISAIEIR